MFSEPDCTICQLPLDPLWSGGAASEARFTGLKRLLIPPPGRETCGACGGASHAACAAWLRADGASPCPPCLPRPPSKAWRALAQTLGSVELANCQVPTYRSRPPRGHCFQKPHEAPPPPVKYVQETIPPSPLENDSATTSLLERPCQRSPSRTPHGCWSGLGRRWRVATSRRRWHSRGKPSRPPLLANSGEQVRGSWTWCICRLISDPLSHLYG